MENKIIINRTELLKNIKNSLYIIPELEEVCDGDDIIAPFKNCDELVHDIMLILKNSVIKTVVAE